MAKYNGHKNWNHWNVSMWINNDENLYRSALSWIRVSHNKDVAARAFLYALTSNDYGPATPTTPDGAPYTFSSVRAAIREM